MNIPNREILLLEEKLKRAEKKVYIKDFLSGFFLTFSIGLISFLALSLLESLFWFTSFIRTVFAAIFISGFLSVLCFFSLKYLIKSLFIFNKPDYQKTAESAGNIFPEIKDELKNSLQLIAEYKDKGLPALVEAAFNRAHRISGKYNFNEISVNPELLKNAKFSLLALLIVLSFIIFVTPVKDASERLLHFSEDFSVPPKFNFEIYPGNYEAVKNQDVTIRIKVTGAETEILELNTKSREDVQFNVKNLKKDSSGFFSYRIRKIQSRLEYFAQAENLRSNIFTINVSDKPVIKSIKLVINPPAYSKLEQFVQLDNGNISVLKGSKVEAEIISSKQVKNAEMVFSDSSEIPMKISGLKSAAVFTAIEGKNYIFRITDISENKNANPVSYNINITEDSYPFIEILSPAKDIDLGLDDNISVSAEIKDDFGFSKVTFNYKVSSSNSRKVEENYTVSEMNFDKISVSQNVYFNWNIMPLNLQENETAEYFIEVFDNDIVSGPKSVKSGIFKIRIPSLNEIFNSADRLQNSAEEMLEKTLKKTEDLHKEMEKITRDLKKDKEELNWDEKEKIEKAMEKFKDLSNDLEKAQKELNEAAKKLEDNNLLSKETAEKYNEMQKLLEEIQSPELREALNKLKEQMQNLMRENVQQSMEDFKQNEEFFKKSLERTIELLKRVMVEQKLDELLKRTEEISKNLENLQDKTEALKENPSGKKNAEKQQEKITDNLKNLEKEMKDLNNKMSGLKNMPSDKMDKMQKEFSEQNNDEISELAEKDLSENKTEQALNRQQELSQNMSKMNSSLSEMKQEMQQKNQAENFMNMMNITSDLINLSKEQEELKKNTEKAGRSIKPDESNIKQQSELNSDIGSIINRMSDLSKKSFAITPEMAKILGEARGQMSNSIKNMMDGNSRQAVFNQQAAMANLNKAASTLKNMMSQMMNGEGGSSGMMPMMQQLKQMSQQQMQLNELTKMMNQGSLSGKQMQELKRLAQQQAAIQKSLEQLNKEAKEAGRSKKLASNLEKIIEEMQEVVNGMNTQKVDDNLIRTQDKILSKLLDAQRSVNERDFEKKREAKTGREFNIQSPDELDLDNETIKNRLRDELMKAAKEGYSKDYQELIKKYFEMLESNTN